MDEQFETYGKETDQMRNQNPEARERASMRHTNTEPKIPLLAVLLSALLTGFIWGMFVLTGEQSPSRKQSGSTGYLVRPGEGVRR